MPESDDDDRFDEIKYVAAAPGYDVLVYMPASKTFEAQAVVAWSVDGICAEAITMLPWGQDHDRTVRAPNGEVTYQERTWPTDSMWLAEMNATNATPAAKDVALSDRPGTVLALDAFRRLRGEQ